MSIKEKIENLELCKIELCRMYDSFITEIDKKIEGIRECCSHTQTRVEHYVDYDRNRYKVYCSECGKMLLHGTDAQVKIFEERRREKLNDVSKARNKKA